MELNWFCRLALSVLTASRTFAAALEDMTVSIGCNLEIDSVRVMILNIGLKSGNALTGQSLHKSVSDQGGGVDLCEANGNW